MGYPPIIKPYEYKDFATLRTEMKTLASGQFLFILDRELQPDQLRELDADKGFVVIQTRSNQGSNHLVCIARAEDFDKAVSLIKTAVKDIGGENIKLERYH